MLFTLAAAAATSTTQAADGTSSRNDSGGSSGMMNRGHSPRKRQTPKSDGTTTKATPKATTRQQRQQKRQSVTGANCCGDGQQQQRHQRRRSSMPFLASFSSLVGGGGRGPQQCDQPGSPYSKNSQAKKAQHLSLFQARSPTSSPRTTRRRKQKQQKDDKAGKGTTKLATHPTTPKKSAAQQQQQVVTPFSVPESCSSSMPYLTSCLDNDDSTATLGMTSMTEAAASPSPVRREKKAIIQHRHTAPAQQQRRLREQQQQQQFVGAGYSCTTSSSGDEDDDGDHNNKSDDGVSSCFSSDLEDSIVLQSPKFSRKQRCISGGRDDSNSYNIDNHDNSYNNDHSCSLQDLLCETGQDTANMLKALDNALLVRASGNGSNSRSNSNIDPHRVTTTASDGDDNRAKPSSRKKVSYDEEYVTPGNNNFHSAVVDTDSLQASFARSCCASTATTAYYSTVSKGHASGLSTSSLTTGTEGASLSPTLYTAQQSEPDGSSITAVSQQHKQQCQEQDPCASPHQRQQQSNIQKRKSNLKPSSLIGRGQQQRQKKHYRGHAINESGANGGVQHDEQLRERIDSFLAAKMSVNVPQEIQVTSDPGQGTVCSTEDVDLDDMTFEDLAATRLLQAVLEELTETVKQQKVQQQTNQQQQPQNNDRPGVPLADANDRHHEGARPNHSDREQQHGDLTSVDYLEDVLAQLTSVVQQKHRRNTAREHVGHEDQTASLVLREVLQELSIVAAARNKRVGFTDEVPQRHITMPSPSLQDPAISANGATGHQQPQQHSGVDCNKKEHHEKWLHIVTTEIQGSFRRKRSRRSRRKAKVKKSNVVATSPSDKRQQKEKKVSSRRSSGRGVLSSTNKKKRTKDRRSSKSHNKRPVALEVSAAASNQAVKEEEVRSRCQEQMGANISPPGQPPSTLTLKNEGKCLAPVLAAPFIQPIKGDGHTQYKCSDESIEGEFFEDEISNNENDEVRRTSSQLATPIQSEEAKVAASPKETVEECILRKSVLTTDQVNLIMGLPVHDMIRVIRQIKMHDSTTDGLLTWQVVQNMIGFEEEEEYVTEEEVVTVEEADDEEGGVLIEFEGSGSWRSIGSLVIDMESGCNNGGGPASLGSGFALDPDTSSCGSSISYLDDDDYSYDSFVLEEELELDADEELIKVSADEELIEVSADEELVEVEEDDEGSYIEMVLESNHHERVWS